jgi:hypothetical protein
MSIGKIENVSLRNVWAHEAKDFTTWLKDNFDVLSNEFDDINLFNPESEKSAGDFSVDIVGEDEDGNFVVIENQLEKSDHNHLGKLLTYLTALEAKIAIWIVSEARPEHINAITWLNESAAADFYFFTLEAIKIDNSNPAPLFTMIVGPSEESKAIGDRKKARAERQKIYHDFWKKFLNKANTKSDLYSTVSPSINSWIATGAGKSGLRFKCSINQHDAEIQLSIDKGKDLQDINIKYFNKLKANKGKIEKEFGQKLRWDELPNNRKCKISKKINIGGYKDTEKWDTVQEEMIKKINQLEKSLRSHIDNL